MTTRSVVLWATTIQLRAGGVVFVCPTATHTILKTIYFAASVANESVFFSVQRPNGVAVDIVQFTWSGTGSNISTWDGWLVLEPRDQISVTAPTGTVRSWGSGALLPQPP